VDGFILRDAPLNIWQTGGGSGVPLLAGWTRDELNAFDSGDLEIDLDPPATFLTGFGVDTPMIFDPESGLAGLAPFFAGKNLDALVKAQRQLTPAASESDIARALLGAAVFQRPATRLAELRHEAGTETFLYQVDWASPLISPLGAVHSSDIGLFFANTERLYFTKGVAGARETSAAMAGALARFARSGDPNTPGTRDWSPYAPGSRAVMIFDVNSYIEHDPDGALRAALAELEPPPFM